MTRFYPWWLGAVVFVLIVRAVSLPAYPLTDTTEARYGEVARLMSTSGNWITPQLVAGEPFWAKPPLSFWQGATSINLFGVSELSLRLPAFVNMLLVMVSVYIFSMRVLGREQAIISIFVLATTVVGFVTAGSVMTDSAMLISTTLVMVSFWLALDSKHPCWGYVFFIALALGFLAKGPIALVMSGVPIVLWIAVERQWPKVVRSLPIVEGTAVFAAIALPWFLIAEMKTPGFLEYFFIGEHLQRYLDSGWNGDRYGTAHDEPRGTIWLFALAAYFPWSLILLGWAALRVISKPNRLFPSVRSLSPLIRYLLLWCLWPMIFFSFAGNILPTYVLSGLPAFALLLAMLCLQMKKRHLLILPGLIMPAIVFLSAPLGLLDILEGESQAALIADIRQHYPDEAIIFVGEPPHSARFYTQGTVEAIPTINSLHSQLSYLDSAVIVAADDTLATQYETVYSFTPFTHNTTYTAYYYDRLSDRIINTLSMNHHIKKTPR